MENDNPSFEESENLADILNRINEKRYSDWTLFRNRILSHPYELSLPLARSSAVTVFRAICDNEDLPLYIFEMAVERYPREFFLQRFKLNSTINSVLYKQLESSSQRVDEMIFLLLKRCPEAIIIALQVHMECMRVALQDRLEERGIFLMKFTCRKVLDATSFCSPRHKLTVESKLQQFFSSNWSNIHARNAVFQGDNNGKDSPLFLYQRDAVFTLMIPVLENLEYSTSSCKNSPLYDILSPRNNQQLMSYHWDVLIKYAIQYYKHHLLTRNNMGETPLYFLIKRSTSHIANKQRCSLLFDLLKKEPVAASIPIYSGRLPFYEAIRGKDISWNRSLRKLLEAAPNASKTRDTRTRMYPFMEAAVGDGKSELLTVFSLLKKHPEAARGLRSNGPQETNIRKEEIESSVTNDGDCPKNHPTHLFIDEVQSKRRRLD